ncbi:MAG: Antidote-toxin recognition MazE, bacterial antitoxin [Chloroflexi bacterium]|jgi:AbrB family looped-hinge helix DNA binding protein|nr:Antidote-toxin recognition MazE, bacterial antitoxin [Chloroflexota bacterium]
MITIRIGRRGQITIPSEIRRRLGLQEGDSIVLIPESGQAILRPIPQTLLDLRGSVEVDGPQDFEAIRQQVISARADRVGHGN